MTIQTETRMVEAFALMLTVCDADHAGNMPTVRWLESEIISQLVGCERLVRWAIVKIVIDGDNKATRQLVIEGAYLRSV